MTAERFPRPSLGIFPSARLTVAPGHYAAAVDLLSLMDVPGVMCDGETILVPEASPEAIELLCDRFEALAVYGCGHQYEFATKARGAGVADLLVHLGNAVWDVTGTSAEAMVQAALDTPYLTRNAWEA